jgi:hypothetical protein
MDISGGMQLVHIPPDVNESLNTSENGYCRDPLNKVKMEEKNPDLRQITRILFCRGKAKERSVRTSW